MHERSLVRALLQQADAIRREHNAGRVSQVRLEVGPLAGIEPLQFATAFEELAVGDQVRGAKLVMDRVPLSAECSSCECEFEIDNFVFRCPVCGGNVRVTRGDALQLVSISLQDNANTVGAAP